jgi:Ca-activated chloride channel family protein
MGRKTVILLLAPLLFFWHWYEPIAKKNQKGMNLYNQKKYDEALQTFLSAKGIDAEMDQLKNNTAASLYQLKRYKEALDEFSKINPQKTKLSQSSFNYNLGNSYYRLKQFDKALEYYKKSILADPSDLDAKINYELTLKQLNKNNQGQSSQQNQQKKSKDYKNIMQYLNQLERKELEKKKNKQSDSTKQGKDW